MQSIVLPTIAATVAALAIMAPLISSAPQSPANALAYTFPADAETLLKSQLKTSFSCDGKAYGYYADVDNNCQVFHICLPIEDDAGAVIETAHWSFICGNQPSLRPPIREKSLRSLSTRQRTTMPRRMSLCFLS